MVSIGVAVWGAMPQVTDVVLKQVSESRVQIAYAPSDEPVVTLHVCTNGVPLPAELLWNATGDVNRKVAADARTIEWNVRTSWPSNVTAATRAEVTAWRPETPPT